jgi:hypothetical protein
MFLKFLKLEWKTAIRSPMWQKNLALNLLIGFFLLLFAFYLLLLGLFMDKIFEDLYPDGNKLELFNGILIYYLLADLVIRFMMQSLPRMRIESYTHLPVRKHTLIHYMIARSILDVFNFIPLFIFFPVTFTIAIPCAGEPAAIRWLCMLIMLILANNFVAVLLKRVLGARPLIIASVGIILIGLFALDKTGFLSLSDLSALLFQQLYYFPILLMVPFAWMILTYFLQYRFLAVHLYPDEIQVQKRMEVEQVAGSQYLRTLGLTGTIIALEMKLYLRNKRTRTILYLLPVFLLYGLLFYPNKHYMNNTGWLMFVGVFMTGGVMLNYANYAFGYESGYFDALLTKNINFEKYIRIKYYIAVLIATICFILTVPYLLYGVKILVINAAMYLYNIGILSFILLYFATYNKKRMDLTRGGTFNYQGIGALNWLAVVPAFLLPIIITIPFNIAGYPFAGTIFTGFTGLAGIFFSGTFIKLIARNFYRRKYIMAQCFREK